MNPLARQSLANGLILTFFDQSNRYYGNFHRVVVELQIRLPLTLDLFSDKDEPAAALAQARLLLGSELIETRKLERMGVVGEAVEQVRDHLIADFLGTAGPYLGRPDYPRQLLASRLKGRVPSPGLDGLRPGRKAP